MPYKDPAAARAYFKSRYLSRKAEVIARTAAWAKAHPKEVLGAQARWRKANPEKRAAIVAKWQTSNRDSGRAAAVRRRSAKLQRTPKWGEELTELVTREAAHLAILREQATGFKWHVDHVIPLRGERVSGLHTWSNLAVIPASANLAKGNRFHI